jgi:hypothetical protein
MPNDIAQQFAGLPIEDLVVAPLIGMAKGQAALNDVTWKYISEVAFEKVDPNDANNNKVKTRFLDVQLNRYVSDPETGEQQLQQISSMIPMLPLVPLPTLAIKSADIEFTMEVKQSEQSKEDHSASANISASASGGFFGTKFNVSMSGSVSTHKENTRSTDNSAKYNVKVHAEQMPPTEGMHKLTDLLGMIMDPAIGKSTPANPTSTPAADSVK